MKTRIEGERLDVILHRLRDNSGANKVEGTESFEDLIAQTIDTSAPENSLDEMLIDFIMPLISDVGIFQESRTISLLQNLRDDLLPAIGGGAELTDLVTKIIDEEIDRYTELRDRRQAESAA